MVLSLTSWKKLTAGKTGSVSFHPQNGRDGLVGAMVRRMFGYDAQRQVHRVTVLPDPQEFRAKRARKVTKVMPAILDP